MFLFASEKWPARALQCVGALFALSGAHPDLRAEPPVFSRDIAPILQTKCLACHSAEKAKGGYRLQTFEALLKPGKSQKPPVSGGKPEASELWLRIISTDPDERMPQKDDPLSREQVETVRAWIGAGASLDRGEPGTSLANLQPQPPHSAPPETYRRPLPLLALAFTPDGEQVAASGYREVTFWSASGELRRRLTNVTERVRTLAFHPDGGFLAVGGGQAGRSGEFSVYNLGSGQLETNLLRTADEVLTVAFSADGKRLACAGTDNAIHLFDWEKRSPLLAIQQHADWVTSICFSADRTEIASASRDRTARIYNAASGELQVTYTGQNAPLSVAAFLSEGRMLSGGKDKSLHIWDVKEGKKKNDLTLPDNEIHALLVRGDRVFTAGAQGWVTEYSADDRKERRRLKGDGEAIFSLAAHEGSHRLAAGSYSGVIQIWDWDSGELQKSFTAAPGWSSTR